MGEVKTLRPGFLVFETRIQVVSSVLGVRFFCQRLEATPGMHGCAFPPGRASSGEGTGPYPALHPPHDIHRRYTTPLPTQSRRRLPPKTWEAGRVGRRRLLPLPAYPPSQPCAPCDVLD